MLYNTTYITHMLHGKRKKTFFFSGFTSKTNNNVSKCACQAFLFHKRSKLSQFVRVTSNNNHSCRHFEVIKYRFFVCFPIFLRGMYRIVILY